MVLPMPSKTLAVHPQLSVRVLSDVGNTHRELIEPTEGTLEHAGGNELFKVPIKSTLFQGKGTLDLLAVARVLPVFHHPSDYSSGNEILA